MSFTNAYALEATEGSGTAVIQDGYKRYTNVKTLTIEAQWETPGACESSVKSESKSLESKGFKIIDIDMSNCGGTNIRMTDTQWATIVFN